MRQGDHVNGDIGSGAHTVQDFYKRLPRGVVHVEP